jgi:hypothetical protein
MNMSPPKTLSTSIGIRGVYWHLLASISIHVRGGHVYVNILSGFEYIKLSFLVMLLGAVAHADPIV